MLKPEQVPDNVEEHFRWCANNTDMSTRECIAAALNAWPGIQAGSDDDGMTLSGVYLPLTQEASDD